MKKPTLQDFLDWHATQEEVPTTRSAFNAGWDACAVACDRATRLHPVRWVPIKEKT